jgi:hypothetical protein
MPRYTGGTGGEIHKRYITCSTSCHSGFGRPKHCFSATAREHATGIHSWDVPYSEYGKAPAVISKYVPPR